MIFISYHTETYRKVMNDYLLPSLIKWKLPYYIKEAKDLGNWNSNTNYKPIFIKECLEKFQDDIVFIDADAIIMNHPQLFYEIPKEYDIGIHFMDDSLYIPNGYRITLLSGTLFMRNNDKIKELIENWIENTKIIHPEQKALAETLKQFEMKIYELPRSYCYIETVNGGKTKPIIPEVNPTIVHYQKSREFKNEKRKNI